MMQVPLHRLTTLFRFAIAVAFAPALLASPRGLAADEASSPVAAAPEIPAPAYVHLMLARDPAVQKELRLNSQQAQAVREAVAEVDQPLWLLRDVSPIKCGEDLNTHLATLTASLSKSLTGEQLARFHQIAMQARGARALTSSEVRDRLRLSESQATQLTSLVKDAKEESLDGRKFLAILTGEQQRDLSALFGTQFDLDRIQRIGCIAPELRPAEAWINSSPLTLAKLRGRVVVVHFWAFGCINCIRNLPHYQSWYDKFSKSQLTIIGIHTPETAAERDVEQLRTQVKERRIKYPVAFDAEAANWKAWANNMWPSVYLIDRQGQVRAWWYGELNWQEAKGEQAMRSRIAELLAEK